MPESTKLSRSQKKRRTTPKTKASAACSRYIRLRDALWYCRERGVNLHQFARPEDIIGKCCTCGKVKSWIYCDAGHYKGRGLGGSSGVYFDERNIHLQCKTCNAFEGGKQEGHAEHILRKYGRKVLDDIKLKHRIPIDMRAWAMKAMEQFYKEKYDVLIEGLYK